MFDRFTAFLQGLQRRGSSTTTLGIGQDFVIQDPALDSRRAEAPTRIETLVAAQENRSTGVTFSVDDVVTAADPLWVSTLGESLEMRSGTSILIMPDRNIPALAAEGYVTRNVPPSSAGAVVKESAPVPLRHFRSKSEVDVAATLKRSATRPLVHPLVEAIHLAFSQHRPLVLSPDGIWLTIVQGFGHHVNENAEALRRQIVRHEGKKQLGITIDSLDAQHLPELISQFSLMIRSHSDPVLHECLLCDFSTTTPTIRTAVEISLMDAYQRYFEFSFECVCGIPEVTLEGTPADWQRMRERVEVLATYDLDWWISRLIPILDEFVATSNGHPNRDFWQAIYKPETVYFTELATGWITDLFPYLDYPQSRKRNCMLAQPRIDWVPFKPEGARTFSGVSLKSFPSGLSRAAVTVRHVDGSGRDDEDISLIGGFCGVGQRPDTLALFPIISWAVCPGSGTPTQVS